MQTASMWVIKNAAVRVLSRVSLLLISLCLAQLAMAQQPVPISPSVVLVLKLVSSTHVKPTTGIVVSDNGLVLVPADFASGEGEMIVLDGGTNILSNGRPAKIVDQATAGDLAVLSVDGLRRPGITLSNYTLAATNSLHLEAFPPAEYIAKGAQPLWVPFNVQTDEQNSQLTISPETPLPYVSGAFIDACGYLAGVSLTTGPQSLDTDKIALTLFKEKLVGVFDALRITLPAASCEPPLQQAEAHAVTPGHKDVTAKQQQQETETTEIQPAELEMPDATVNEPTARPVAGAVAEPDPQATDIVPEKPSIWREVPLWLPLTAIIILGVLIWKASFYFRLGKNRQGDTSSPKAKGHVQPASDEPVTAPLESSADTNVVKPRSAPVFDFEIPESAARPDGCNGVLVIEGMLDADTSFKRFCFVNTEQINLIIGRGDADINIEHAAISRAHARVESDGTLMSFSDLGSRNGSFIGDVPCLPGEIMYIQADDEIFLGDVKFKIHVVIQEAEWA